MFVLVIMTSCSSLMATILYYVAKLIAYTIALNYGELDVAYSRIMLLGPGGAGKSSLKRGLMSKPFDSRMNSTIVADVQSVRHEWAKAGDQWTEVTPENEVEELAQLLATIYNNPRGSQTHLSSELATTLFAGDTMPSSTDIPQDYDEKVKHRSGAGIFSEAMAMAKGMRSTEITQLKPQPFLHIWDCGGQPVFLEVLPAFLTSRTMFLLLFDASTDLNTRMRSVRYQNGIEITEGEANMTTLELMEGWMSNIHASLVKRDEKRALLEYPRVITVGTRGDKLKASEKDRVTKTLEECLQDRHYSEVLGKHKVLIVDNTTSGQGEKEDNVYKYLRKEIDDFTSEKLNVRTPITWVLFRKVLQMIVEKESRNTITIGEAVAVGNACRIEPEDVPKVLKFYHELGVVLFYPHIKGLGDKVILSPKWFVDCLGKVLALEGREAYGKMWYLLKKKGILVQPLYATAWRGCDGVEPEEMIQLLVHFGLAAELETKQYYDPDVKQFFVPAVLPTFTGDPSSAITAGYKLRATPLHITFSTGYVIPGFFTRLVTSMAMIDQRKCSLQFDDDIFQNRITFKFHDDDVIITALPHVIQVDLLRYIPDSPKPIQESCESLQDLLKTCCQQVKECLQFINVPIEKMFKFVCQECDSDPHYLLPSHDGIYTSCERKKRDYRNFTDAIIKREKTSENIQQARPEFSEEAVMVAKAQIRSKCQQHPDAQGIIFVVDMLFVGKSGNQSGTHVDAAIICKTFSKLNFAVYAGEDLVRAQLACLVQAAAEFDKYPMNYDFIAFYYAGHGGIDDVGREFVLPLQYRGDDSLNVLYIEDDILSPFRSGSQGVRSKLKKERQFFFFFDCCLDNTPGRSIHGTALKKKDFSLKSIPASCLVAFATSINHRSGGDKTYGGLWTRHLCKHLNSTEPLAMILDRTRDDVVNAQKESIEKDQVTYQRPHYKSDVGIVYFKEPLDQNTSQSQQTQQQQECSPKIQPQPTPQIQPQPAPQIQPQPTPQIQPQPTPQIQPQPAQQYQIPCNII